MKRVFMISRRPLFSEGLEELLRQKPGLQIVGREQDFTQALAGISAQHPDVVIVDCQDDSPDLQEVVTQILQQGAQIKVIGLDLNTNTAVIQQRSEHEIRKMEDFYHELLEADES